jgi:hypothetical protein
MADKSIVRGLWLNPGHLDPDFYFMIISEIPIKGHEDDMFLVKLMKAKESDVFCSRLAMGRDRHCA